MIFSDLSYIINMSRFGLSDATMESVYIGAVAGALTLFQVEDMAAPTISNAAFKIGLPASAVRPLVMFAVVFGASFIYNNLLYSLRK